MKFMKKKVLGLVASIAMVLSLFVLPVSVNAANENVAKIGDTEYATLSDALNKANDNDVITLINDTSAGALIIDGTQKITLDLNGRELSL